MIFTESYKNTPNWNKMFTHCLRRHDFCLFVHIYKTHRLLVFTY